MIDIARHSRWLQLLVIAIVGVARWQAADACTITTPSFIDIGSKTSFEAAIPQVNAGSGGSGLACSGLLGLLDVSHIYLTIDTLGGVMVKEGGTDTIPFQLTLTPGGAPLAEGTYGNLAGPNLLSIGGAGGQIHFYINVGSAANVSAGTYTATIILRWHYAVCQGIGALGLCVGGYWVSPGVTYSCLLVCSVTSGTLPGPGTPVEVKVQLEITPDCRFDVDDIDFGAAPFAESFEPVNGALRVRCTKGTTYTVGLSEGNYSAGGRRRMASGANRLEYDVYHAGGQRWDDGANRAEQLVPAQGNVSEVFPYEARIYSDQTTPPIGFYQDSLIIDVEF
jgi:spore coat protein U-like protein